MKQVPIWASYEMSDDDKMKWFLIIQTFIVIQQIRIDVYVLQKEWNKNLKNIRWSGYFWAESKLKIMYCIMK